MLGGARHAAHHPAGGQTSKHSTQVKSAEPSTHIASRVLVTYSPVYLLTNTQLQAAPYATIQQLTAMRQTREQLGEAEAAVRVSLPLTSPECLGRASVDAALGLPVGLEVRTTKQRGNYRCVTREVISSLECL